MARQGAVERGHTAVGCGHFENKKLNAIVIGDMKLQLINPLVKEESLQS